MKTTLLLILLAIATMTFAQISFSQGNFIYDQQSSDEGRLLEGGDSVQPTADTIYQEHSQHPVLWGQTFTPTFDSVGFVRLNVYNGLNTPGTMHVELFATPNSHAPLGISSSITVGGIQTYADFYFITPVAVSSGNSYFIHPVADIGNFGVAKGTYNYSGGDAYFSYLNGAPSTQDYWFREGIIAAPEPSAVSLIFGGGILFYVCRKKFQTCTTK
jgi:hypothetical protein